MCGIAGFYQPAGLSADDSRHDLDGMSASLRHRGPDDCGSWYDDEAGVALGHRRLSILDLSPAGHQPMLSASGRFVLTFNGEIYNHLELRKEVEAANAALAWRGHSDTEILLAAFETWGIAATLRKSVGMFAFGLWDRRDRCLTLARDRLGEKPLYYGWQGGTFLFGSELKALRSHRAFRSQIDRSVLVPYFARGYIPAPHCIYQGVHKLPPGTYLEVSAGARTLTPRFYWSLRDAAENGLSQPLEGSDAEAVLQLEAALKRAVLQQSIADVPLGAFLSGGVDSSTIVALMQAQSSGRTKTFTIGFQENEFDESANAAAVARHLGTDHTQLIVTAGEAMSVIPRLSSFYDEPFGDSSAIPTFLVSRLAREHVKVSLSGDGGDELFGGYARYQRTNDIWQSMRRVPLGVRRTLSLGARAAAWRPQARVAHGAARVARYLEADSGAAVYTAQLTQRHDIERLVLEGTRYAESLPDDELRRDDLYSNMMFMDATRYLPDDILVKVDRASMAVGLEGRVPMLDHRVVELAWRLPLRLKVRDRTGKWILREILRKYVPDSVQRPGKRGFGVPIGSWVRGPLKDWAESLLDPTKLRQQGVLDVEMVRTQWDEHLHQDSRHSDRIWHVLAFQAWMASVA